MARPREQGINTAARSLRQLRRFCHLINADKVFSTHKGPGVMLDCLPPRLADDNLAGDISMFRVLCILCTIIALIGCAHQPPPPMVSVSYTHLRAHETGRNLVCRLLL